MSIIEKEGKTVEQAIEKGLKEMGLSRDEVQVEIVSLGSSGFLGVLGGRPAKVRLNVQVQPRVKRIVETILAKMGFPGTVRSFSEDGGRLTALIESELGENPLQANNGAALDAMEYLIGKIFHESEQDIHLDIGGFRQSQGNHLKTLALELARKVKETGQEQKLAPMPPHQRKVIHKALENHPDVRTFAVGEGDRRRVIIAPRQSPSTGSASSPQAGSGHRPGPAPRPPDTARHSGQTPRQAGPQAPHKPRPQPEAKPQPEPRQKTTGKPGRRDSGRKPQVKPPRPQERQEQAPRSGMGQASRPVKTQERAESARQAAAPPPQAAPPLSPGGQETGFVPRSKKKPRRS